MRIMGAVLVIGALALVGCTDQPDTSTAASTTETTTTTTATSVPASTSVAPSTSAATPSTVTNTVVETVVVDPTPILTHSGFGAVSLGMTAAELVATGLVGEPTAASGVCDMYEFKSGNGSVWTQEDEGVMAISVKSGARTTEGLWVDTNPADPQVAATYPGGTAGPNGFTVWVGADVFYFVSGGTTLARRGQACFN